MAEISEPPNPSNQIPEVSETSKTGAEFDPKTMRKTKPGLKRLFLTFSVLFSFLLGFPLLWKSVEIYRSPLPFDDIDKVSTEIESNSFPFPFHFEVIFITNSNRESAINLNPHHLKLSLHAQITKLTSKTLQCGACTANNFTLSVTLDRNNGDCKQSDESSTSYKCGAISAVDVDFDDDEGVDDVLESKLGGSDGRKVYSVVVVGGVDVGERVKAVVGKYRHGWIVGRYLGEETVLVERVAEMFVKVFANGGREEGLIHEEFMPVGADGRIVLSFSLLNANPSDWVYDW